MNLPAHLGRGERAPDFVLPVKDGTLTRFYARAGGVPTVLIFTPEARGTIVEFARSLDDAFPQQIDTFIVQSAPDIPDAPFRVFADTPGKIYAAYRVKNPADTVLFVLDRNLRILASGVLDDPERVRQNICRALQTALSCRIEPREIVEQAPVLLISNVLNADISHALINIWETQGNEETGVEQSVRDRRENVLDPTQKKRRDHTVADPKLMRLLTTTIGRRVMPELRKAFHFTATRFEGFKIVCYDGREGGFFRPHRDNLSPATAYRRFALTLNLNTGYGGGHLRFPEYGPHLYKPGAGCAIVFSCAHLHEVTPVTDGVRFALLSFLFGEDDIRQKPSEPAP